jgi:hypothetical protein
MRKLLGFALVTVTCALFRPTNAEACGGCFTPQSERTVVTDHRMALAISPQQTVLWDQIRYSGDPAEFAWVLPVRAGAKLEISNDEWFTALDASTQPVVYQPNYPGGRFGCALTGCGSEESTSSAYGGDNGGQVQILSQSVVGPYETVTLRATDDDALRAWLKLHDYAIPEAIAPTIDAYVREGFDFIALRLRPGCNERSMQPVRVVTSGADPTLPLRMVAAGVGAHVGITLFVITEGRWQPQNFESAVVDDADIRWNRISNKSNYDDLSKAIMERRAWITEYANLPQLPLFPRYDYRGGNPGLTDTYFGLCKSTRALTPTSSSTTTPPSPALTPCPKADGGPDPQEQPAPDAGADAAIDSGTDAGTNGDTDAGEAEEPASPYVGDLRPSPSDCHYLDDLDVAISQLHRGDVWVTRLRADLPVAALAEDLKLTASPEQKPVSNVHYAPYYSDEDAAPENDKSSCLSSPKRHRAFGTWALGSIAAIALVAWRRRRTRR